MSHSKKQQSEKEKKLSDITQAKIDRANEIFHLLNPKFSTPVDPYSNYEELHFEKKNYGIETKRAMDDAEIKRFNAVTKVITELPEFYKYWCIFVGIITLLEGFNPCGFGLQEASLKYYVGSIAIAPLFQQMFNMLEKQEDSFNPPQPD